ncbi:hypothetical protein M514_12210 [Trichuris suis]|uniref:Uncharacterized protein n=1 Tax=Trichuris suis TaxID=68888 RepID=A0A085N446_9BILA|nr:hypothetical protein M513_12210 [Trichuris suis]KFD64242.1 hypothetical protein M514_12210 [Trichuris suis]
MLFKLGGENKYVIKIRFLPNDWPAVLSLVGRNVGVAGEVGEPFLEVFVIIEGNIAQIDSERTEKVIIRWSDVRRITRMRKHLPSEFFDGCFCDYCCVRSGVVVLQHDGMLLLLPFLLNCARQTP